MKELHCRMWRFMPTQPSYMSTTTSIVASFQSKLVINILSHNYMLHNSILHTPTYPAQVHRHHQNVSPTVNPPYTTALLLSTLVKDNPPERRRLCPSHSWRWPLSCNSGEEHAWQYSIVYWLVGQWSTHDYSEERLSWRWPLSWSSGDQGTYTTEVLTIQYTTHT